MQEKITVRFWRLLNCTVGELELLVSLIDWYFEKDNGRLLNEILSMPRDKKIQRLPDLAQAHCLHSMYLEAVAELLTTAKRGESGDDDEFITASFEIDDDAFTVCRQALGSSFCSPRHPDVETLDNFWGTLQWKSDTDTETMQAAIKLYDRLYGQLLRAIPVDRDMEIEAESEEELQKIKENFAALDVAGFNMNGPKEAL